VGLPFRESKLTRLLQHALGANSGVEHAFESNISNKKDQMNGTQTKRAAPTGSRAFSCSVPSFE